jgi:hypothetical protein
MGLLDVPHTTSSFMGCVPNDCRCTPTIRNTPLVARRELAIAVGAVTRYGDYERSFPMSRVEDILYIILSNKHMLVACYGIILYAL